MAEQHERIGRASLVDPMTGLGNRRRLQQVLERPDQRFAAVLLDIDRFRTVNDEHGQEIGDAVLRRTADLVQRNVGDGDVVVRYGADEFVVLVPGGFGAAATAERLLEVVRKEPWLEISLGLRITVSVGLAGPAPAAEALAAADLAAAEAKRAGRDRLVTA
nr:GGDEF domain-containing protein [Kineococcus aurantiacus]